MPHTYVSRYLDLGEPLELDIRVEYSYTDFGAPPITSGPADNWDPGWGAEIEIDEVICDQLSPITLSDTEYYQVLEHANEGAATAYRDSRYG